MSAQAATSGGHCDVGPSARPSVRPFGCRVPGLKEDLPGKSRVPGAEVLCPCPVPLCWDPLSTPPAAPRVPGGGPAALANRRRSSRWLCHGQFPSPATAACEQSKPLEPCWLSACWWAAPRLALAEFAIHL